MLTRLFRGYPIAETLRYVLYGINCFSLRAFNSRLTTGDLSSAWGGIDSVDGGSPDDIRGLPVVDLDSSVDTSLRLPIAGSGPNHYMFIIESVPVEPARSEELFASVGLNLGSHPQDPHDEVGLDSHSLAHLRQLLPCYLVDVGNAFMAGGRLDAPRPELFGELVLDRLPHVVLLRHGDDHDLLVGRSRVGRVPPIVRQLHGRGTGQGQQCRCKKQDSPYRDSCLGDSRLAHGDLPFVLQAGNEPGFLLRPDILFRASNHNVAGSRLWPR